MVVIVIGFALFIFVAIVVSVVLFSTTGQGGRRGHDSNPAFWNNPPDSTPHTHGMINSSASDAAAHRLHQQSDHHSSHEFQHSWGGDSGGSSGFDGGGGSSGGDGGSSN